MTVPAAAKVVCTNADSKQYASASPLSRLRTCFFPSAVQVITLRKSGKEFVSTTIPLEEAGGERSMACVPGPTYLGTFLWLHSWKTHCSPGLKPSDYVSRAVEAKILQGSGRKA